MALAVALGPAIDVLQWFAAQAGLGRASQGARGVISLAMLASVGVSRTAIACSRFALPLALLGAYGLVRAATQVDDVTGLVFLVRVVFLILVYACAEAFAAKGELGTHWLSRVAWVILCSLLASQVAGGVLGVTAYRGEYDFPGITGQPAVVAASAIATLPLLLAGERITKANALAVALVLASISATQRRSALIAAAVALSVYVVGGYASGIRRTVRRLGLVIAIVVGGIGLVAVYTPLGLDLGARFADLDYSAGGTASGRMQFQRIAVEQIALRGTVETLFGEGFWAIGRFLGQEFGAAIGAHNDWIDLMYSLGIVGVILFAWLHVKIALLGGSVRRGAAAAVYMALSALLVLEATAGGALDPTSAPLFALFGVVAGQRRAALRAGAAAVHVPRCYPFAPGCMAQRGET